MKTICRRLRRGDDLLRSIEQIAREEGLEAAVIVSGVGCVSRIYTDLAVIDITDRGPVVREIFNGLSFEELQRIVGEKNIATK